MSKGVFAKNGELVENAVTLLKMLDVAVMTPEETGRTLRSPGAASVSGP